MRILALIGLLGVVSIVGYFAYQPAPSIQLLEQSNCLDFEDLSSGEIEAIKLAKQSLPEHANFVDPCGTFDVIAAEDDLVAKGMTSFEAIDRADAMEREWKTEFTRQMGLIA